MRSVVEDVRVGPTGQKRVLAAAALLSILLLTTWAVGSSLAQPYDAGPDAVPEEIESRAIGAIEAEYGPVREVYGEAETNLGYWIQAEPGITSGLDVTAMGDLTAVYALFIRGDFTVKHGPSLVGPFSYAAGRVVVDGEGRMLAVSLWRHERPADPPFSEDLDDS